MDEVTLCTVDPEMDAIGEIMFMAGSSYMGQVGAVHYEIRKHSDGSILQQGTLKASHLDPVPNRMPVREYKDVPYDVVVKRANARDQIVTVLYSSPFGPILPD
ncbi:hypothetical protein BK704_13760 [[Bacillus thuringiensis] serovar konkukian]|nr:hypothetical protein [Bacillus thuringiensis]MED1300236.1 hypothetical protein [Bacillus pacificus]OUB07501.1 hypothetical protein BK704_13760 [[Bacillus thuringiensis] serovar konkukian]